MSAFTMIAERIKHFRSLRRKTQVNLAQEASIDYRHFQKLEAGQSDFKVSTIFKLAGALAVPACYLLQVDPLEEKAEGESERVCPNGVLGQLGLGLVAWTLDGKIAFCNREFSEIVGTESDVEGLKNMSFRDLIVAGDSPAKYEEYKKAVLEGKIKCDFIRMQIRSHKSGEVKSVMVYWHQVTAVKGGIKGYAAAVWDERDCRDLTVLPTRVSSKIG